MSQKEYPVSSTSLSGGTIPAVVIMQLDGDGNPQPAAIGASVTSTPYTLIATTLIIAVGTKNPPFTVTLKSADATRKIEFSTDGGTEYFIPAIDITSATMLITYASAPITHIKVTGLINDTLIIVG
jgi:hypothetical protein